MPSPKDGIDEDSLEDRLLSLREDAEMRENVFKNAVHLVHLYGYQGETQLGK